MLLCGRSFSLPDKDGSGALAEKAACQVDHSGS
jgi:hypothetical protein